MYGTMVMHSYTGACKTLLTHIFRGQRVAESDSAWFVSAPLQLAAALAAKLEQVTVTILQQQAMPKFRATHVYKFYPNASMHFFSLRHQQRMYLLLLLLLCHLAPTIAFLHNMEF